MNSPSKTQKTAKTVGTLLKSNKFFWTSNMQKANSYGEAICNVGLVFAMPEKLIRERQANMAHKQMDRSPFCSFAVLESGLMLLTDMMPSC